MITSWQHKMSIFSRIARGLKKTSNQISDGIGSIFTSGASRAQMMEELEELLIMADMGAKTSAALVAQLDARASRSDWASETIQNLLADIITEKLAKTSKTLDVRTQVPCIIMAVGVNGNGKTTSLGKLAKQYRDDGLKVMMIAADTFRAAAVEQLEVWAKRAGAEFVKGATEADPASVVHTGVTRAFAEKMDVVLVDTAGRLHTKHNLMQELSKIISVVAKLMPGAPHHIIQVIDATTGQNAVAQVKAFTEMVGVNGLVITKLDGTAKAGVVVALAEQFALPVYHIGVGEGEDDLMVFNAAAFAGGLVGAKVTDIA